VGTQRVIVTMPDELVAAVDQAAATEERSRAWMIRRAVTQFYGLPALVVRPTEPVATPNPSHVFKAQAGNALRCECGQRRVDHH
jgi:hypothetical protein